MAGVFERSALTAKGIALMAKAGAGLCTITFTQAATGDGTYTDGEDLSVKTALKSQKQSFQIKTVTVHNASNVFVQFVMTNHQTGGDLQTGYNVKEIGIFATDPDEGEILYSIAVVSDDKCDYMPPYNNVMPSTIIVDYLTEVANTSSVSIEAPNQMFIYDDETGTKYVFGIQNGNVYYEEADA